MSFIENIPNEIKRLEEKKIAIQHELNEARSQLHDCDCEYCDVTNSFEQEEAFVEFEETERSIQDETEIINRTLNWLRRYQKKHNKKVNTNAN
jgi:hypothetical protein